MAQGKLGFGFMRLPVIGGVQENINLEQLKQRWSGRTATF